MIEIPTGNEFVASVSSTIAKRLKFEKWVSILYDVSTHGATSGIESELEVKSGSNSGSDYAFRRLAFEAKTFQKLSRISIGRVADDVTRAKFTDEITNSLKRFTDILVSVADDLNDQDKENFKSEFLDPTEVSFGNLVGLLDDFSAIKDYYLFQRDEGESP